MNSDTQTWDTDNDYLGGPISKVTEIDSDIGWIITIDHRVANGITAQVTTAILRGKTLSAVAPVVGETARIYGELGDARGLIIEGRVYGYQSKEEHAETRQRERLEGERERQADLEATLEARDNRRNALPWALRDRLIGFLAYAPEHWRRDYEPYELDVCEMAAAVAQRFEGQSAVLSEFDLKLTERTQRALIAPIGETLDKNGWNCALSLSTFMVAGSPTFPSIAHAARCCIDGCKSQGCYATRGIGTADEPGPLVLRARDEMLAGGAVNVAGLDGSGAVLSDWIRNWVYEVLPAKSEAEA
jgi:hypothetical protein